MRRRTQPFFSVVLNTYNRADVLPRAVLGVLAQTFGDLELVIVDDGSTDHTRSVATSFDDERIRYVYRDNGGLASARNAGLAASAGRFVAFVDDDDLVDADWLETFARVLDETNGGIVTCGARIVTPQGAPRVRTPAAMGPAFLDQTLLFLAGTFVVRRDVLVDVGGYWEELRCSEQTELSMRVLRRCLDIGLAIRSIPHPKITLYRAEDENRPLRRPDYLCSGALLILDRHTELMDRDPALQADYWGIAAVQSARLGNYRDARRYLRRAIALDPFAPKNYLRFVLSVIPAARRRYWPVWMGATVGERSVQDDQRDETNG